ncbi:MAG: AMP-binding protein [Solirubrobacteraceae bacterium]
MNEERSPWRPTGAQTLIGLVQRGAEHWGERPVLVFDEHSVALSYSELHEQMEVAARKLARLGVAGGARVAVMLRNRAEFPVLWLALARLGAILVPLNVYYQERDASFLVGNSGAELLITEDKFVELAMRLKGEVPALRQVVSVDPGETTAALSLARVELAGAATLPAMVYPETPVNLQYTSGTTGHPKGCLISQFYWHRLARLVTEGPPRLGVGDVMLTAQPFYYMDPQWNLASALMAGATLVVLDRFHPSSLWEKIREYEVSFFYCLGMMPAALYAMAETPQDRQHRLKAIMCSAIPLRLHAALEERWGVPWYETFGMTETGGDLRILPIDHDATVGLGCIGRPYSDRELRVVDENGVSVLRGATGEMVLRGPGMMERYFGDPEATARAFRGGWLHTGDLVRQDREGRVFYLGRLKDTIRRSGENISAAEVEGLIMEHPDVAFAACVPVPDELRGEEVKAYVVLRKQAIDSAPPAELANWCFSRFAYFKVPRYWAVVDDLPRTPSERVAKSALVAGVEDLRLGAFDAVDEIWR